MNPDDGGIGRGGLARRSNWAEAVARIDGDAHGGELVGSIGLNRECLAEGSKEHTSMSTIRFTAKVLAIDSWTILRLPAKASAELPSRGQTMVEGTINGFRFQTPLEPDGAGSHWFRVDKALVEAAHIDAGDTATLDIAPTKAWPEPAVPADLRDALSVHPPASALWHRITPMARWDWVRWIRATSNRETRKRRIEVACSKLEAGQRRPCCFNRNLCTEPSVSRNGVLLEPANPAG